MKNIYTPILMYHSVSTTNNAKFSPFTVPPARFAEQMAYLSEQGYTPLTVTHYMQVAAEESMLPERPVVLTFDDGFEDFFTAALPILQRYHFSATLYVATAFVGKTSRWLCREGETGRPMLTWEQVVQIDRAGIECGGHGHTHPQLDTLPDASACDELARCKDLLQRQLGHQVLSFAYPFGYYTAAVQRHVSRAGYTSACAVRHRMSSGKKNPLALTRFMVTPDTTIDRFERLLTGTGLSMAETLYLYGRTAVWGGLRRGFASLTQGLQEGGVAQ